VAGPRGGQPRSSLAPCTVSTFEPMPSIAAPIAQQLAEILHVRLAAAFHDHGRPARPGRAISAFSVPSRCLVEWTRLLAARAERAAGITVDLDVGAQRGERHQVRVDAPAADHVAAGAAARRPPEARKAAGRPAG